MSAPHSERVTCSGVCTVRMCVRAHACPLALLCAIVHGKHQLMVHALSVTAGLQKRLTSSDASLLCRKK